MRRFRTKRRKPELNATINVTNLVDVALTILIVFMLIAPLIEHSIRVVLPKAEEKELSEPAQVKLEIAPNQELYLGEDLMTPEELSEKLKSYAETNPAISVNVQSDARIPVQELVDVLDIIRKAGITRIGLATEVRATRP